METRHKAMVVARVVQVEEGLTSPTRVRYLVRGFTAAITVAGTLVLTPLVAGEAGQPVQAQQAALLPLTRSRAVQLITRLAGTLVILPLEERTRERAGTVLLMGPVLVAQPDQESQ